MYQYSLNTHRNQELLECNMTPNHNGTGGNESEDSSSQCVVAEQSFMAELPQSLNIKSADLRIGDIIGQGIEKNIMTISLIC